eukprot:3323683-Amphidinium_carterae.2
MAKSIRDGEADDDTSELDEELWDGILADHEKVPRGYATRYALRERSLLDACWLMPQEACHMRSRLGTHTHCDASAKWREVSQCEAMQEQSSLAS